MSRINFHRQKSSFLKSREICIFSLTENPRGTIRPNRLIQSRLSLGASTLAFAAELPLSLSRANSRGNENKAKERKKKNRKKEEVEEEKKEEKNARNALHCNFDFIKKWRWSFQVEKRERERVRWGDRAGRGILLGMNEGTGRAEGGGARRKKGGKKR